MKKKRPLRKGFTTGSCAAAAARAAVEAFCTEKKIDTVSIPLPTTKTLSIPIDKCYIESGKAVVSVVKDAGDDPDVTNGAEIWAEAVTDSTVVKGDKVFEFWVSGSKFSVFAGEGIGTVTKPGLSICVGEPAVNPVPRRMIKEALGSIDVRYLPHGLRFYITISVPKGEMLAEKTMNPRLGIIGGISILGTTGIVEPLSLSAYKQSIACAMDIAGASGCSEVVLSTGRTSERTAEAFLKLPEEAFILVGDHMGFALREAAKRFKRPKGTGLSCSHVESVTIAGQFGKLSKLARGSFQTHFKRSRIELGFLAELAKRSGAGNKLADAIRSANTAREVLSMLRSQGFDNVLEEICRLVRLNAEKIAGKGAKVRVVLIDYDSRVLETA